MDSWKGMRGLLGLGHPFSLVVVLLLLDNVLIW